MLIITSISEWQKNFEHFLSTKILILVYSFFFFGKLYHKVSSDYLINICRLDISKTLFNWIQQDSTSDPFVIV